MLRGIGAVNDLVTSQNGAGTRVAFDVDNDAVGEVMKTLTDLDVRGLTITPPSLEELFMRHYGDVIEPESGEAAGSTEPSEPARSAS